MSERELIASDVLHHDVKMVGKTYLERGKPVVVLVRWNGKGPRNVLIQREDGTRVVRPFRGLRKSKNESDPTAA